MAAWHLEIRSEDGRTLCSANVEARRLDEIEAVRSGDIAGILLRGERITVGYPTVSELTAWVARERPDALLISPSPANFLLRRELADFAVRQRLPTIASVREEAVAGALMSYGPSNVDRFRTLADYIDRVFKGARAGDIPVVQPTKFQLVVNADTARALGLTLPPALLLRADRVIDGRR